MDLALNNLQRLICHKTQQTKLNQTNMYTELKLYDYLWIILIVKVTCDNNNNNNDNNGKR